VNFGGGHHIARDGYDVDGLCATIEGFRARHDVDVYLEPGEGVVMDAGVLVASVLDVLPNGAAILDASASAHMPYVLEMPYRVDIRGAAGPGERAHTYWLGGPTCMAGDVFGQYSFNDPLEVGHRLVFEDMAPYTMVKNTMFNGVPLPRIAVEEAGSGRIREVREFGYEDYKRRLS
jgi:carboxynorspermidine decarboxylase